MPEYGFKHKLEYMRVTVRFVFTQADTIAVRLMLANMSLVWAFMLVVAGYQLDNSPYRPLSQLGSGCAWGAAFAVHGLGVYWRLFDPKERLTWSLIFNTIGFVTWFLLILSVDLKYGKTDPASAMEWVICATLAWVLCRTVSGESRLVL